jgi:hypothetical protein
MPPKRLKRLVIDASVVRAAGRTNHPVSKACRDCLSEVMSICHSVVMSKDVSVEWKRHRSNFAFTWQASMMARKKLIPINPGCKAELRTKVVESGLCDRDIEAVLKDLHLVEVAFEADHIVISRDEEARRLLQSLSAKISVLRSLIWVNPERSEDQVLEWLREGAKSDKRKTLGFC